MKYKINIPEPCHEDWQQMTPTQKGKFCASCQKEVIDFTKLSSIEITRKTKNAKQLCGRFTSSQLEQEYVSTSQNSLSRLGIALGLGSIIAVVQPSFAQEKRKIQKSVLDFQENIKDTVDEKVDISKILENRAAVCGLMEQISISGTVTDQDGFPIPGVNVISQNSSESTHTDFDGNFKFSIYKPYDVDTNVVLVFSSVGMETEFFTINTKIKSHSLKIKMTGYVLGELIVRKPNIFQRFLNLFRSKENKRHY